MHANKRKPQPKRRPFRFEPGAVAALVLASVGLAVYWNSFSLPYVFDGREFIADHPPVTRFWPPWAPLVESNRPVGFLSFAVNYALHGTEVWGYHAVNLAIHVAAAWVLFAIVRHTLTRTRRRSDRDADAAWGLALAVALVWLAHPLQTQSVTYIYQRLESLMGLFYLLTLYLFIRGVNAVRPGWWYAGSVACCVLGMGTKEVMVTAPVAVLWYDRALVSQSWREMVDKRTGYYAALFGTWAVLALIMVGQWARYPRGGVLVVEDVTPIDYALSQPAVILHYLRLSIWPTGLCLDYDWPVARAASEIVPPLAVIAALLIGTLWCAVYRPAWGFVAGSFFLILAPTSSIAPIKDLAFEHRMYLPLAAVVVLIVVGGYDAWQRLGFAPSRSDPKPLGRLVPQAALLVVVALAGYLTILRNADYESARTIWQDTVRKRPNNSRAWYNLGHAYQELKRNDLAADSYTKAIELEPGYAEAYNNRGYARQQLGQHDLALSDFDRAIKLKPGHPYPYHLRAALYQQLGQYELALHDYGQAIRLKSPVVDAFKNRATILAELGRHDPAIADWTRVIEIRGDDAEAYCNRGNSYQATGKLALAARDYTRAIELKPDLVEAYNNRGTIQGQLGHYDLAVDDFSRAIALKADYRDPYGNRAMAYYARRQYDLARADVEQAQKLGGQVPPELIQALAEASR